MLDEIAPLTVDDVYDWVRKQPRIKGRSIAEPSQAYKCLVARAANDILGGEWYVAPSFYAKGYMSTENCQQIDEPEGYRSKVYGLSPELNALAADFDTRYGFLTPHNPSRDSILVWMRQRKKEMAKWPTS